MKTRILWNPASGRGRGARDIVRILAAFGAEGITDARPTTAAGDEARLVREALADGCTTLVVVGGDGTWSNCAIALARDGSPARMAFVAAGTGNDFAKNLRAPAHDPVAMARLVASGGVERRVDLGRVDDTWFLNVAGFGFDVAVLKASLGFFGLRGPAVYVTAALAQILGYGGLDARVVGVDGLDRATSARRLLLVFSNGREFGGAFRIAPHARVDDGMLDAVICNDGSRAARLPLLARAMRGTHLTHPMVQHGTAARFALHFPGPVEFEADGELRTTTTGDVEIASMPGILAVLDAPS